jgi:hypothetical protein
MRRRSPTTPEMRADHQYALRELTVCILSRRKPSISRPPVTRDFVVLAFDGDQT